MPRQARLNAPEMLHHVRVRGLGRRPIFQEETGREEFVTRLPQLAGQGALTIHAWVLLLNHAHLLFRNRCAAVARAREAIAYLALEVEGYTGRTVADVLGGATSHRSTGRLSRAARRTGSGTA